MWRKSLSIEEVTAATRQGNPLWSDEEFPAHSEAKHQVSPLVVQFIQASVKPWWEVVPGLRCSTLVLTGDVERGAIITEGMAQKIRALNPRVEVVRLAGAGHNVRREQFDAFVHHVRRFLSERASAMVGVLQGGAQRCAVSGGVRFGTGVGKFWGAILYVYVRIE